MATKTKNTKSTERKFDFSTTVDKVKSTAKDVNTFVLDTSEDLVDETLTRAAQWQEVGEKALKGGLKLVENQQDIMFTALESVKSQLIDSRKRFRTIFN